MDNTRHTRVDWMETGTSGKFLSLMLEPDLKINTNRSKSMSSRAAGNTCSVHSTVRSVSASCSRYYSSGEPHEPTDSTDDPVPRPMIATIPCYWLLVLHIYTQAHLEWQVGMVHTLGILLLWILQVRACVCGVRPNDVAAGRRRLKAWSSSAIPIPVGE